MSVMSSLCRVRIVSYSNEDSMVLVKEYTNRAMGQNGEPRNKPTQI